MINKALIYKFFTTERRPTGKYFLTIDLSRTFLNTRTTDETFQQSGKQDSFKHILKSSGSIYERSGSQFLRSTTGTQLGREAFEKARLIMTFLTKLGVTETLCNFRLVLDGKTGK